MKHVLSTTLLVLATLNFGCAHSKHSEHAKGDKPQMDDLIDAFRQLGAPDPESWANSQTREGIPQLARYLLLTAAWQGIVSENDPRWIDREIAIAKANPDQPGTGAGRALSVMRAKGVTDEHIIELVRVMQYNAVHNFMVRLDEPPHNVKHIPLAAKTRWQLLLTETDSDTPKQPIHGLYESLMGMDPTGRELRPKPLPQ